MSHIIDFIDSEISITLSCIREQASQHLSNTTISSEINDDQEDTTQISRNENPDIIHCELVFR